MDYRKSEGVRLIVRAIVFKISNLGGPDFTNVSDRQTDGRHAIAIPRIALKCIAR